MLFRVKWLFLFLLLPRLVWGSSLYGSCVQCHGDKGQGTGSGEKRAPRLGGQHAWYLEIALKDFRKGARRHPVVTKISDKDIAELSAYLSALK